MAEGALSPAEICAAMVQQHTGKHTTPEMLRAVASGASGRSIMRAHGVLAIHWTADRADNNSFLPAAKGLAAAGLRVPAILAEQKLPNGCGACLVEDLGSCDLLSLKHVPREEKLSAYRRALTTLLPLGRLKPDWELQPAFDAAMYRWEQEYFAEHLLGHHLGRDAAAFLRIPALQQMANWLAELPRVPVHRDFQSQNIMLRGEEAWLIDFQGMRNGRVEYDLASLLCDPYMELTADEQQELLQYWAELSGAAPEPAIYSACAMQRLMQALGAFANIGHNLGKTWYLERIPAGLKALCQVAENTPEYSPAHSVAQCLLSNVR